MYLSDRIDLCSRELSDRLTVLGSKSKDKTIKDKTIVDKTIVDKTIVRLCGADTPVRRPCR
jgi:hypothetical protein